MSIVISVTGPRGSGKSSVVNLFRSVLRGQGIRITSENEGPTTEQLIIDDLTLQKVERLIAISGNKTHPED